MKQPHILDRIRQNIVGPKTWGILILFSLLVVFMEFPGFSQARTGFPAMELMAAHGNAPADPDVLDPLKTPDDELSSQVTTIHKTVRRGDTPSSILNAYLPLKTIYKLDAQSKTVFPLTRIRRGQPYTISLLEDSLYAFEYEIDSRERLLIQRTHPREEGDFSISKLPIPYEIQESVVTADITTTLSAALKRVGETHKLAWKLADIFAWDIDFTRDIKPGDTLGLLVEKKYRDGKFFGYERILAATFTNRGRNYQAYYFEEIPGKGSYYDGRGNSLRKAFLKSPVNYSRISSKFSKRRFHPILKKYRAHLGIDYAAPRNTPIKAVADGSIIRMGYGKDAGRFIVVRHKNGYETSYFHMNKFAKGMKRSRRVTQGDIIGYVGKTGLATGYHLCFRMKKNGKAVNPMAQASISTSPVPESLMANFLAQTRSYDRSLGTAGALARGEQN
ncbi:MAG: peptidoglycan DD-metalloendopeptidase family protein [Desulfobacterales bacterium]|nr:peptidoglycan DD-metalloendopeptidase family protein [Desulfobacterales bacterium]